MTIQTFCCPDKPELSIQVYRLDQNHQIISGNKLFKLQPWLKKAVSENSALLSCGGAYSNHLYALAFAGQQNEVSTYGLVRGLEEDKLTVTLKDCKAFGMNLIRVSREEYRERYSEKFVRQHLRSLDEKALWVPEGGTDESAVSACEQIGKQLNQLYESHHFTSVWVAVGSGGTLAGITRTLHPELRLYAVPVMRNWQDVRRRVDSYLTIEQSGRICWVDHADYGGFGRYNQKSITFHQNLETISAIRFDPVYTAKVVRRMLEMYSSNEVNDSAPLMVHTGGLQGRRSISPVLYGDESDGF